MFIIRSMKIIGSCWVAKILPKEKESERGILLEKKKIAREGER